MSKIESKVEEIFPQYEAALKEVENFREKCMVEKSCEFVYNNVSILGKRGSGKTTILLKLKKELEKNPNNTIMRLIVPSNVSNEQDLLGWIIKLLNDESEKLKTNTNYKRNKFNCYDKEDELDKLLKEVKKQYFIRKPEYSQIIRNEYSNKSDYINENNARLCADIELQDKVKNLIAAIVENKKSEKGHMIIFMIDDVDICASMVSQVLKIIMNYLNHPNVVTYVAGDYDSFIENISLEYLKTEEVLSKDLLELSFSNDAITLKERREERAYDFLKKVLPENRRYYIKQITNIEKYSIIRDSGYENVQKFIELLNKHIFVEDKVLLNDYFSIFDDNIRGLVQLIEFIGEKEIPKDCDRIGRVKYLNELLDAIIGSKIIFYKNKKLILDVINLPKYNYGDDNNFKGYINYYLIVEELRKKVNNNKVLNKNDFLVFYEIFILCNMFEILIIRLGIRGNPTMPHGNEELIEILNSINTNKSSLKLFPEIKELKKTIQIKEKIFKKLKYEEIQQLFNEKDSGYLESEYINSFKYYCEDKVTYRVAKSFEQLHRHDLNWCENIIDWIFQNIARESDIFMKICGELYNQYNIIENIIAEVQISFDKEELKLYENITSRNRLIRKLYKRDIFNVSLKELLMTIDELYLLDDDKEEIIKNYSIFKNKYSLDNDKNLDKIREISGLISNVLSENEQLKNENIYKLRGVVDRIIFNNLSINGTKEDYLFELEFLMKNFYRELEKLYVKMFNIIDKVRLIQNEDVELMKNSELNKFLSFLEKSYLNYNILDFGIQLLNSIVSSNRLNEKQKKELLKISNEIESCRGYLNKPQQQLKIELLSYGLKEVVSKYAYISTNLIFHKNSSKVKNKILFEIASEIEEFSGVEKTSVFLTYIRENGYVK